MRIAIVFCLAVLFSTCSWFDASAEQEGSAEVPVGQKIFVAQKCNTCHSLKAAAIESTMKEKSPAAKKGKQDLSTVGKTRDDAWIEKFLMKKEPETGAKHPSTFKGKEDELKQLAEWLSTFKEEKK